MTRWLLSIILIFVLCSSSIVHAEESDKVDKPNPNIYEKKDVELNINLRDTMKKKDQIPEKQQKLQFDFKATSDKLEMLKHLSFLPNDYNHTVLKKSVDIGLFAEENNEISINNHYEDDEPITPIVLILFSVSIIIVIILLIMLVLRVNHKNRKSSNA